LPHRDDAQAGPIGCLIETAAVVLDLQLERCLAPAQTDGRGARARVPRDVVERFLKDPVHVNADCAVEAHGRTGALDRHRESELPVRNVDVRVYRGVEAGVLENGWVQRL